ncbi:hypothetical protein COOONC_21748 [Cooperia oncophora]
MVPADYIRPPGAQELSSGFLTWCNSSGTQSEAEWKQFSVDGSLTKDLRNSGESNPLVPPRPSFITVPDANNDDVTSPDGSGAVILADAGKTFVTVTIAGKRYTTVLPGEHNSISTLSSFMFDDGIFKQEFSIIVNGVTTYTYRTINGQTTVFDGQGRVLNTGDSFWCHCK